MNSLKPRVAVVILAFVAGCAGIPDSGPVTKVDIESGPDQSTVRYSPAGPREDATPQQIVRGYLDAMLAYPVTTGTAAAFLTPTAARGWKSSAGVSVYVEPDVSTPVVQENEGKLDRAAVEIELDVVEDARLDPQGKFARVDAHKQFTYRLTRTEGQWRITNPQAGFLVNRKFFGDYYRAFDAYFFDRPGKRLVADPVYLPVGDQLSTALLSTLLKGPQGFLGGTARTFLPKGARLRTSVPSTEDGVADVQFRDDLSSLSGDQTERLSAQIVWTLRQVEGVTGVRIAGGDNVLYPGNRGIQSVDSWEKFGPRFGDGAFYAVRGGKLVELSGDGVAAVGGPWGKSVRGAVELAVDDDQIAIVAAGRKRLSIGNLTKTEIFSFAGSDLLAPLWDDNENVWAVDRADGKTRLRIFTGKKFREIPIGHLADFRLDSFSLSPDGSHYAAIARVGDTTRILVGTVQRNGEDVVVSLGIPGAVRPQDATYANPRSVSWATATSVTFLADDNVAGAQLFEARIDSSSFSGGTASSGALLPDVDAVDLATTGGEDPTLYVTDGKGRTWLLPPGGSWDLLDAKGITAIISSPVPSTD